MSTCKIIGTSSAGSDVYDEKADLSRKTLELGSKFLEIVYTNTDVLSNKMEELQSIIQQEDADLVAITEVLPKNIFFPVEEFEFELQGYQFVSNIQIAKSKGGRGICFYIKEGLHIERRGSCGSFMEDLFVDVVLHSGKKISVGWYHAI